VTAATIALPRLVEWPTAPLVAQLRSMRAELDVAPGNCGPALLQRLRLLSDELDDVAALIEDFGADGQERGQGPEVAVDPVSFTARLGGKPLALTYREFRLLQTLVEHRGRVLTRPELMALAWDAPGAGRLRTVDVHVRRLRVLLGTAAERVVTVRSVGYRFQ
jgi:DNA-binding response OmpR family regulator